MPFNIAGLGGQLFPVDPSVQADPNQVKALQGQALLKMGLGMMAAAGKGAGIGGAAFSGYDAASNDFNGALQNAYNNTLKKKASDLNQQQVEAGIEHNKLQLQQQQLQQDQLNSYRQSELDQSKQRLEQSKQESQALKDYRDQEIALRKQELDLKQGDAATIETNAKLIANYQSQPLSSFALRSPWGQQVMARVLEMNPNYNSNEYGARSKAYKDFSTGQQGNAVRSFNVALDHLNTLRQLSDALNNGNFTAVNQIGNFISQQTGNPAPTNFDATKKIVGDEIVKAIIGKGGGVSDREEAARTISKANSPAQLIGVIDKYSDLMASQLGGLKHQYETSTGRNDFETLLSDRAKQYLSQHANAKSPPANSAGWSIEPVQ